MQTHSITSLVVLDADLSGSTRTVLFGKQYPDRFFNVGVMEPTMITMASGLALSGRTVFASTFAIFEKSFPSSPAEPPSERVPWGREGSTRAPHGR